MQGKKIQSALLALLRQGLWGKNQREGVLSFSAEEWLSVYQSAKNHTVEGIVFDGIQGAAPEALPPLETLLKWTVRVDQIERRNQEMNAVISEQISLFNRAGLTPVLLKGQGLAACYPVPSHRVCGDVDWYFEGKPAYRKANALLLEKGISLSYSAGFSAEYAWRGVPTEHHARMFDIHNPLSFTYLNRLQREYRDQCVAQEWQGQTLLLPAPLLMTVQVNVHILKHLLSFGIGLRQLCDAAIVYRRFHGQIDGQELKAIYQRLGITRWVHALHAVLVSHLGLPRAYLPFEVPEETKGDWMLKEILETGNFGFFDARYPTGGTRRAQSTRRVYANLKRYLPYAPLEVLSFPVVQTYSKWRKK